MQLQATQGYEWKVNIRSRIHPYIPKQQGHHWCMIVIFMMYDVSDLTCNIGIQRFSPNHTIKSYSLTVNYELRNAVL